MGYVELAAFFCATTETVKDRFFSIALAYTSRLYSESMAMRPEVTYTPCAASPREKTGDIITFAHFEEGNILTKTRKDAERGDESDNEPIMIIKQDIDAMNYVDKSDHDLISTEMLEHICDVSQTHPNVNRIEASYKIRDRIRQRQS